MKKIFAVILSIAVIFSLASCGLSGKGGETTSTTLTDPAERENKIKVAAVYGPTALGLLKLKNDRAYAYTVDVYSEPQKVVQKVLSGEADIAALPVNLAAKLYNETNGGIKMIAMETLGVLHIVSNDESIESFSDLKGKTVFASGKGSTPEYIINYLLRENGMDPEKDITVKYYDDNREIKSLAIDDKADICILPEPFVSGITVKNSRMKDVADVTAEFEKAAGIRLAQGCIVAQKKFIDENPDLLDEFCGFAEMSVNYVNNVMSSAYETITAGFFENYDDAQLGIPASHIVFMTGKEMMSLAKENIRFLYDFAPEAVGGAIPGDEFYN